MILDWRQHAACTGCDPEFFFNELNQNEAKAVCRLECGVRKQCLQYAMVNNERFGVWGGYSRKERLRLREVTVPLRLRVVAA